jgi:hypothetical protein
MGELQQLLDANTRVTKDFHRGEFLEGDVLGGADIDVLAAGEVADPGVGLTAPPGAPVIAGGPGALIGPSVDGDSRAADQG